MKKPGGENPDLIVVDEWKNYPKEIWEARLPNLPKGAIIRSTSVVRGNWLNDCGQIVSLKRKGNANERQR